MPLLVLAVGVILGRIPGGTKHEQGLDGIFHALLKVVLWDQGLCKFTQELCCCCLMRKGWAQQQCYSAHTSPDVFINCYN